MFAKYNKRTYTIQTTSQWNKNSMKLWVPNAQRNWETKQYTKLTRICSLHEVYFATVFTNLLVSQRTQRLWSDDLWTKIWKQSANKREWYSGIVMEKLRKTTKYLSQRNLCSGEGSIPVPLEFNSKVFRCSNHEKVSFF